MAGSTRNPWDENYSTEGDSASGGKPWEQSYQEPEKPKRTWGEAIKDTGSQLAEGVNTTLGAIPSVLAPQSKVAGFFRDNTEHWRDQQSDVLKGRIAETDKRIQEAGKDGVMSQIGTAASEYWNDPAQAARLVATNLPSMAATLGTGAAAGFAAKGVAAARGLDAANKAALAAKYGTTTAAATNAVLNAGGARGEAFEDLQKSALAQGMTPEQAEQAGVSGSILPGVVGGVAGAISGKIGLEKAILGQATTGAAMRKAAGAFGAELAGEQIEELAPKVATNYQVGRIDPGRTLTDDLGRTMVETAIGAGPGAVVAGGAAGMRTGELPPVDLGPAAPPAPPQSQAGPTLALPAPDQGVISVGGDGTARTPAYQQPGYVGDVTDVEPRAIDPVRAAVESAANEGGALSGAALTAIDSGASSAMQPVAPDAAPPAPISLEEADARDQAAYEQFFANLDAEPVVGRYVENDNDIPDFDAASNVSDEDFLRSLDPTITDQEIQDAIATSRQPTISQSSPAVDAGAQTNEPTGTGQGAGADQAAQGQVNAGAIQQPAPATPVPAVGGPVGADGARGAATAVPDASGIGGTRPGPDAANGAGAAETGAARPGGRGNSNPELSAPTNLRDALVRVRAQKQEAANAQTAAQSAPTSALAVSTARPGAVEAAVPAPVSPTTGVTNGPQAAQAQQSISQPTQAGGAATAGPAAAATAGQPATVGGSGVQAAGVSNAPTPQNNGAQAAPAPGAQAQAPGNANWAALTPEQRRRARLEHEIATGQTNNGGVVASLRPSAIEKRKQELAAMGDAGKLPSPGPAEPLSAAGLAAQGQAAPGAQGAAQAAQAGVAPRPKNWRTSMLGATPVAKAMGIDTKGKRLAQVVAEIDARDTQAPATPAPAPTPGPARLGRDNTPLSEGGKPFKTRKAAGDAKKLQPMMRVVTVPGGYALAEKTPAQLAAEDRASRRLRNPNTSARGEPIPAHAFIAASGGLHMRHRNDLGVDGNPRIGNRRLFGGLNRGLSIEQATEMLVADGYLSEGASHNDAYALIKKSLSQPQYNADGIERIAQAESDAQFDDYMAAQEEAAAEGDMDPFDMAGEFTSEELDDVGYTSASPALQAEVNALIAQADAMDIDTSAILEDIARTYANATQDQYNAAARDALAAAIARSNQDGGSVAAQAAPAAEPAAAQGLNRPAALTSQAQEATENVAPEALELAALSPAQAAAQQDAQEQAAKAEAAAKRAEDAAAKAEEDRKRIAQASVRAADRFELGQDPMDSLTGQGSVFDAQEPEQQAPAATENVAISSNGQDEKAIRYELPPEKYAQQQGDESWMAAQSPSFKPTARQQLLMDAVAKALDDGAFYNSDVDEHVAKTLGVTLEQRARNSRGVEGGDFGYDVYNATRAVHAQRSNAKSREFAKALNLKPGDVLGTLVFNDGKVTTGVKVNGLNDSGLVVTVTGKRGAATLNGEVGIDRLAAAMDSAKERGKRKDGYAEFVAGRGAVQPSPQEKKPSTDQPRAKTDALTEREKAAKAKMLGALGKLAALASKNTRMNWTPEEEQKLLPIVIELFDGAIELGAVTFQKSVAYVRDFIAQGIDQETADAIPFETLQGAYIAVAGRHKDKGVTAKKEVAGFDSLDELQATAEQAPEGPPAVAQGTETLTLSLYKAIRDGGMPKDNPALKKLVEAFDGKPADSARMKQAQEELETAIAMSARDIVAKGESDKATFDALLRLYESQPNLNIRTSTSVANQAYSTPAPLAFLASRLAGITRDTVAHEPTGGTGMLLIGADPKKALVNELNDLRISALKAQGFAPTQKDAATMLLVPEGTRPDAVVTNPPFGSIKDADGKTVKVKVDGFSIGQIDHLIAARALETMKDDGKATLILGANKVAGGLSTDDRIFFNWLYSHYNVAGHFEVEGDLYARQGAGWPVRVITINGRQKSGKLAPVAGTIQRADNWSQVYEQFTQSISSASQSAAAKPADGTGERAPVSAAAPAAPGGSRPQGSTGSAGNVAGARPRVVPDSAKPAAEPVGPVPDEQRLNAESFVPQPQPGQEPAGAQRPSKPAGTTAVADVPAAAGNEFQSPYVPRSARKDDGVLIPSNMAQPTQDALNRLEDSVGDIDEFARSELGYATVADLHNALMGLQVDSVATAIYQIKQNKAVVIADQTGIGKGRQAASIIRWAARNGMTPVFVSVKPSLFTDMCGDLADIGTSDVAPFILNSSEWVSGTDGEKLFANKPSTHRAAIQSIVDNAALPQGRNALFMTYSQINTANLQRQALMALAPNAVFVLDESHNAAGDSGTGEFMISVLKEARGVTYLSATYAKRPDNMPLYFKTDIGDAAADSEGLADAMAAGGLPLQTVVSNNLVKAGQMFRRERSYDGVSIASTFDTANRQLHERLSDEATEALRAIVSADKLFHSVFVKSMDKALKAEGSQVQDNAGNQVSAGVQHTEFSSVVHNFVRQMLLGLKAQTAADEAIASLKRGEKPIIAVENTMGSFLSEYAAQNNINQGDRLGAFDYRTVLSRALERSRVINVVLPNGDKSKKNIALSELDPITRKAYDQAQAVIDGLAIDIPVSPIDWMRAEIIRAGFTVAEITGRDLSVDYSNPRKPVLSAIDLAEQKDKVASTRRFNGGELDALILNVAGSTGISLHASEKFADQRQRHMIVAQAAGDINIFMQMLGRVHRTGQVRLPKYTILSVDLPTEKRPTAVLSRKMKSLNANTSSNTESATSVKTADILNKYGDQIVNQYLVDNLELARQLGVDDLLSSDGERVSDDIARKATGRLALQPIEVQRAFYEDVEAQYDALIEYLNKTNQNDLEPRTFDFDAKEVRTEILFDGPNKATPFGEDAVYGEYSIKAQGIAMKPEEIQAAIAESLQGKTGAEHARDLLNGLLQTYVEQTNAAMAQKVGQGATFDLDEYAAFLKPLFGEDGAARMMAQAQAFMANGTQVGQLTVRDLSGAQGVGAGMEFLRNHTIGKTFRVEINSELYNAVITNVRNTHKTTGNPFSLSKFQITVALNGALRSITVPATQFRKIEVSSIAPAFRVETLFKEQPPNQRETAKIVTGNLLAAYGEIKGVRGTIISFTKADGVTEQGILLPKLFDFSKNTQGDYRLRSGADALKFLQQSTNKDIGRFGIATRDGLVRVLPRGDGVQVRVPKSKAQGARYFLDKNLIAAAGDFVSTANAMVANVEDAASAAKVLDLLMDKQALYALPSMAEEAQAMAQPNVAFSRATRNATYSPQARAQAVSAVTATTDAIRAAWGNGPEVIVAFDMQDAAIPERVRQEDLKQRSGGAVGTPEGFYYQGKVYLMASQLNTPNDAARVLFHEALGHYGLRGLFGKALTPILNQIATMRKAEVDAKIKEYGLRGVSALDRRTAAEEVLAEMAQATPNIHFVKRAVSEIRNWLRANVPGFKSLAMTDNDIIQAYILPARRFVERQNETMQQAANRSMAAASGQPVSGMGISMSRNTKSGRIRRSLDELVDAAKDQESWKTWYNRHEAALDRLFADDAPLFQKILSATSQATGVKGNVSLALKAYDQMLSGLPFDGYLPAVAKNLERIQNEQALVGAKIAQYGEANEGNTDAIAVDRHISMLFFNTKTPNRLQIQSAKARIRKIAERLQWEPRQVQAALWAFNQVRLGTDPTQVQSYDTILEDRADLIEALRARHQRGEGGSIQTGSQDVQGGQEGSATEEVGRPAYSRTAGDQTQTEAFKRWFAGSKVVDEQTGKPRVLYHGTHSSFTEFKPNDALGGGMFFSPSPEEAGAFTGATGSNIMPVYLSAQKVWPKIVRSYDEVKAIRAAKSKGYDAIRVRDDQNGVVNWVVFDPIQVKSATGNSGTFDPANADIRFSRADMGSRAGMAGMASKARDELANAAGAAIKSVTATNIKQRAGFKLTDYLGLGLQALGRRQIVDIYGDLVPLAEYNRLVQQMEADKNEGGAEADQLVTRWAELPDEGKLADLMHEATLAQIDPEKPYVGGDDKAKYAMLAGRFNALSQEARQVYTDTRDAYQAHHAKVRSAIKERIERSELKGERKAALLKQMDDEFFKAVKGVYFPLARFGQYAVTVKGPDGKVESVSRAETKAEAEALRSSLLSAFPRDKGFTVGRVMLSKDFIADRDAVGRGFMTELYQVLDKQDMDAAQRAELEDTLGQLYLSSLPDLSWAKHGIHRKGTPGFSQDARRAYAQNMFHGARYLAKLRYSDLMQDELTAMQKHVDDWREVEDFDQNSAQRVADEMNKRHESLMNPKSNPLSTALTSLGFVFHLGLSPASAMVNLSQTALVAYPIMGAKWGFGKASAALLKASAEATKGKNDITGSLNADERAAYDEAVRAGTIDVTMAHDLAGIAQGEDAGVMWKIRPVMRWASFLFHHAERFNRQVTFVASYRLAREAGADQKAAFEQATKATYDGHFDYGAANRPRVMQGNVAKVLLLFKQYGQNMVYTLSRNAYQSIKGTDAEKAEARKVLAGLLTSHAMAAGVLGLPMVTTLLAAASMIGGDDDEPWDAKVALQNMLADTFGQKPAEVLAHGLSRLTPWDISGRVGLDRLIFPDVQEGLEGQRLAESSMAAALGPVAGIGVNVLKGAQHMSEGRYALGLESMLPSALRGPVKAIRYANEGVQDKSGISILDEVSPAAVAGQALGFSPSQARNAQEGKSAVMAQDRALGERRQELLTKVARAAMAKDAEALAEARKEIAGFNEKNPGRRITPLNITQSVRNRQKRIDQSQDGVYLPKNRRDAMEAGRFALGN